MIDMILAIGWLMVFLFSFFKLDSEVDKEEKITPEIFKYGVWMIVSTITLERFL